MLCDECSEDARNRRGNGKQQKEEEVCDMTLLTELEQALRDIVACRDDYAEHRSAAIAEKALAKLEECKSLREPSWLPVWVRPHRGGFEESMKEARCFGHLTDLVRWLAANATKGGKLSCTLYYDIPDDRNNWLETWLISDEAGPFALSNRYILHPHV